MLTPRQGLATAAGADWKVQAIGGSNAANVYLATVEAYAANTVVSIADIQDVLGHESDKMARHYAGEARELSRPTAFIRTYRLRRRRSG